MTTIRVLRIIRWTAFTLIIAAVGAIVFVKTGRGVFVDRLNLTAEKASPGTVALPDGVSIGGPFSLIDDKGQPVTEASFPGRWLLVFFGYSNCPDECPLTLQKVATALETLGPVADRIAPLFITVDPVRDTTARLAEYLANFDTRIVGLTGTDSQIAAIAKAYRVYYAPAEHEASGADLVSHSRFLYLMTPQGTLAALFAQDARAGQLAAVLRGRISPRSGSAHTN
jgi:cytochrome oxidase Cu insertion factor (SCO1/SenC/PrrC family)